MWDIRYRPLLFADVLGQPGAVLVIQGRLIKGTSMDTSYIFSGAHGQGKTTMARISARAMLCDDLQEVGEPCNACDNCKAILNESSMAFVELDAASKGTIDNVRAIVADLSFVVPGAPKRIYLFDEAHRMSRDSQDVLLKPIEDKAMVAILCTTEPEKIRGPIRSRCEEHSIKRITREDILGRMKWVLAQEKVEGDEDAILTVIDFSGGHVRDVLNKLEMIAQLGPITIDAVRERLNLSLISTYYDILLSLGAPAKAIELVESACDRVGAEEVSSGLAEAAMNSYRLARKMYADFVYVDREKAQAVHEMYGDAAINLAEHFLVTRRVTKTSLVCDVVRCVGGAPVPRAEVAAPAPVLVTPVAVPAPGPALEPPGTPPPPPAPEAPPPPAPAPPDPKNGLRSDGVGNMGSPDIQALTVVDTHGVSEGFPRRKDDRKRPGFKGTEGNGARDDLLTSDQWRREFAQMWPGGDVVE